MSLLMVVLALNAFIILPPFQSNYTVFSCISGFSTLMVYMSFFTASCKDPGNLKPLENYAFLELLHDINPVDLCPECKVIRTARSRHCAICNQCVERFDHHCPWINNCVGIKNHNAFLMFLISIWVKIVFHMTISIYSLQQIGQVGLVCESEECLQMCLACDSKAINITSCVICIIICFFYLFISTLLLATHFKNYCANRTTNERLSRSNAKNVRKSTASKGDASEISSSIMSFSDFEDSGASLMNSVVDDQGEGLAKKEARRKRRGCIINCWKMATHSKIVP